jgi:hypothetical protein
MRNWKIEITVFTSLISSYYTKKDLRIKINDLGFLI